MRVSVHPDASPERDRPTRGDGLVAWARWYAPLGGVVLGLLLAGGLLLVERWRRGSFILGAVAVWAAICRGVLPDWRMGVLAVRSRRADMSFLAAMGAGIMFLAWSVDDPLGWG